MMVVLGVVGAPVGFVASTVDGLDRWLTIGAS